MGWGIALFSVSCLLKERVRIDGGLGSSASFVGGSELSCLFLDLLNANFTGPCFKCVRLTILLPLLKSYDEY